MDTRLIIAVAKASHRSRDRLLVLLGTVTGLDAESLRTLTVRGAVEALRELPAGTPYLRVAAETLRVYRERLHLLVTDLLFPSRKRDELGLMQAVGRVQVWRVVRDAVVRVFGAKARGALRVLRALVQPQESVSMADVAPMSQGQIHDSSAPVPTG